MKFIDSLRPGAALDWMFPDAGEKAGKTLGEIPSQIKPYYDDYINRGKNIGGDYEDMSREMMMHPDDFINRMGQGYQKSPGYDWNLKQGEAAIGNANAAGGMAGTPQHEQQNAEMATGLASQDYQKYMDRIMQGFGMGQQGASDIYGTGAKMSGSLADNIAQVLSGQAGMQYADQQSKNARTGKILDFGAKLAGGM
jgi:hypothetical protein